MVAICLLSAAPGLVAPGASLWGRILPLILSGVGLANVFFFGQIVTRFLGIFRRPGRWLLLGLFYLGLIGVVLAFVAWVHDVVLYHLPLNSEANAQLSFLVGTYIGWSAAAFAVLGRRSVA